MIGLHICKFLREFLEDSSLIFSNQYTAMMKLYLFNKKHNKQLRVSMLGIFALKYHFSYDRF